MPAVQKTEDPQGYKAPHVFLEDRVDGFLEGPQGVIRVHSPDGRALATIPHAVVTDGSFAPQWLRCARLRWSHRTALAILEGQGVQELLLGANLMLVDGKHRPPHDPHPGVDDATLALFDKTPDMPPAEIFKRLRAELAD